MSQVDDSDRIIKLIEYAALRELYRICDALFDSVGVPFRYEGAPEEYYIVPADLITKMGQCLTAIDGVQKKD